MAATAVVSITFHPSYLPRCSNDDKQFISVAGIYSASRFPSCTSGNLPRRFLLFVGSLPVWSIMNPAFGVPMPQMEEPEIIRTRKLAGGVRVQGTVMRKPKHLRVPTAQGIQKAYPMSTRCNLARCTRDIVDGEGLAASDGDVVEFNYVCRRANGYFVYSTVDQFTGEAMPVTLPLAENQMIKGLMDVIIGMKIGGKRRALIPPQMGYVNEQLKPIPEEFGPRRSLLSHANEPLVFEVQLLKIL